MIGYSLYPPLKYFNLYGYQLSATFGKASKSNLGHPSICIVRLQIARECCFKSGQQSAKEDTSMTRVINTLDK